MIPAGQPAGIFFFFIVFWYNHCMRKERSSIVLLLIFFFAFCVIGGIVFANARKWYDRYRQQKEVTALRAEIARLKSEEEAKRRLLEAVQSPFFIEREGREKFGAKKPGETTVLFPKFENTERLGEGKESAPTSPFFRQWLRYFFPAEI